MDITKAGRPAIVATASPESKPLRRELGLPPVLMQSIGTIAPALTLLFTMQLIAQYAGVSVPLALVVAAVIMVMAAVALSDLAKRFPSAGGYYAYISEALGPRWGLGTAWMELIYMVAAALNAGFVAKVLEDELKANFGFDIPWQLTFVVVIVATRILVWRGVKLTGNALVVLGTIEVGVLLVLGIWGFANAGPGGIQVANAFTLGGIPKNGSFALAVVFGIFFYAGWEGAAPIAEETRDARRNVPIAMIASILILGVVFIIACWGTEVGWGTAKLPSLVSSSELPNLVLAHQWWGGGWIIVLLVLINSMLAFALCGTLVATRMLYALSRADVAPQWLNRVHPRFGTPYRAVAAELVVALVVGLALGQWLGPKNAFFIYGLAATLLYITVYVLGNLGVVVFFWRRERANFNIVRHLVFPVLSAAALGFVFYNSVNPFPSYPIAYGVWWAIGWAVAGLVLALLLGSRAKGKVLAITETGVEYEPQ